ncbi:hypothetical protein Tco_1125330 [Tanacetum coccineum]|uniref:Uncharacterized protein n=1 Tax=Tanacetum coccineum TaxID=301880 RepID=A0ABQ5JAD9_9ASTR
MISTGSSTKLSLSSSRSSFIGMTRDSSDKHFFRLETWKVLWTLLSSSGSSSLYATGPIRSRILKGPILQALSNLYYFLRGFMEFSGPITSSGWPFVSTVLGQMAHLVASITLNSASIRPEGFLSSVLLWLVIIVAVVGVGVTVVVAVESSSIVKLSLTCLLKEILLSPGVPIVLSAFAIVAHWCFRSAVTQSAISFLGQLESWLVLQMLMSF